MFAAAAVTADQDGKGFSGSEGDVAADLGS